LSSPCSPINELAHFLDQILRPLVVDACRSTTFLNGTDFLRQLDTYSKSKYHYFQSMTLFATFKIINFYSILSHNHILDTLGRFLTKQLAYNRFQSLSIITIENLTELFLNNIMFYYNNKIYQFRKGIPNCLRFTETLANIFLLEWQVYLLTMPQMKNEFYGRFVSFCSNNFYEIILNIVFCSI
jgi:hypothetical protein